MTAPDEGGDDANRSRNDVASNIGERIFTDRESGNEPTDGRTGDERGSAGEALSKRIEAFGAQNEETVIPPNPLDQIESTVKGLLQQIATAREQALPCAPLPVTPLYDTPLPPDPRLAAYPAGTWLWQAWRDPSQIIAKRDRSNVPDYHPFRLVGCCDLAGLRAPNEIPLENSEIGEIVFSAADEDLMLRMGGSYETLVIRTPDGMQYPADTFEQNGANVVFTWRWLPTWIRGWFKDGVIDLELCGTGNRCALDPATNTWNCSAAGQVRACVDTVGARR